MSNGYLKQVIVVRKDLSMPSGKLAAMVAHASMTFLLRKAKWVPENHVSPTYDLVIKGLTSEQTKWCTEIEHGLEYCDQLSFAKIVLAVDDKSQLQEVMSAAHAAQLECHLVIDGGHSHNKPNTLVCAAIGPDTAERLEPVTGHLKIYR